MQNVVGDQAEREVAAVVEVEKTIEVLSICRCQPALGLCHSRVSPRETMVVV